MNILQINKYHYIKGGSDRVYFNTGELLSSKGHNVKYFSTLHPSNYPSDFSEYFVPYTDNRLAGVSQKALNTRNYLYDKDVRRNLDRLIDRYRPDIAHIHLFYGGLSASVLRSLRSKGIPVVHTVHDYRILCPANSFLDSSNNICERCINKTYIQCALRRCMDGNLFYSSMLSLEAYIRKYVIDPLDYIDHFIFVSKFALHKHLEFDNRFAGKSSLLYNFTRFENNRVIAGNRKKFLYYGRLAKEKGLGTLLTAAAGMNIDLTVAGSGPLENMVLEFAGRYSNINYVGFKSGNELNDLIGSAYFVVVPSEWYENNPMTVLEAYALGKPVIGARIGGIPEIVEDGVTGFLFKPGNQEDLAEKLSQASEIDEVDYIKMAANSGIFALGMFSPDSHYDKLFSIYESVIKK